MQMGQENSGEVLESAPTVTRRHDCSWKTEQAKSLLKQAETPTEGG